MAYLIKNFDTKGIPKMTYFEYRMRRPTQERMMTNARFDSPAVNEIIFPIDIKASNDAFELTALLPGISPDDLSIQIQDDTVILQGELKYQRDLNSTYLLTERPSGRFSRVLTLPTQLASNGAEADLSNGVLVLRIPKAESAKPRTIKVNSN